MKLTWVLFFFAMVAGVLTACSGGSFSGLGGITSSSRASSAATINTSQIQEEYRLGAGDQLRVIVFGEDDLSGEFVVDGAGHVSLPLVGQVQAESRTVREFQNDLENALKSGFLNEPRVSAEVLNFRPFYIMGEVEAPGEYPYTEGLTVLRAVATAEGFTYRANTRRVFIKRAGEEGEIEAPLTTETQVSPGDTVRIVERFF